MYIHMHVYLLATYFFQHIFPCNMLKCLKNKQGGGMPHIYLSTYIIQSIKVLQDVI